VLRPYTVSTCWPDAPDLSALLSRPDLDPAYRAELESLAERVCNSKQETVFGPETSAPSPESGRGAAPVVPTGLKP
jgi:hypothetical protein